MMNRVRFVIESRESKAGTRHRARLYVGRKCVHSIGAERLAGLTDEQVEVKVAAAAAVFEKRMFGDTIDAATEAAQRHQPTRFDYQKAKERFMAGIDSDIGPDRRMDVEDAFRLSVESFFLQQVRSDDPTTWPAHFDQFRMWLCERPRQDGRKGRPKANTANRHISALNKFLRFCREVYDLYIPVNCKSFGKRIIERQSGKSEVANGGNVWTEEQYLKFRELAYRRVPLLAPIYDMAFGLGLRRGEAIAIRKDAVHPDDDRLSPFGHVDIIRQYTPSRSKATDVIKLPKWDKTRVVPIGYPWIRDVLAECLTGRLPARPWNNPKGLRYVVSKYSNVAIAEALDVSETAVRKYLDHAGVKRRRRIETPSVPDEVRQDIREHVLFVGRNLKEDDYLFTDEFGNLPTSSCVGSVFARLAEESDLPKIRLHDLRHSFGTIWAQRLPPMVLKNVMGHSSITTTERYTHTTDEIVRASMERALESRTKKGN